MGAQGQGLPLPAPSGPSSSSSWTEDSFEIQVLLEPFSETEMEGTGSSVNQPPVPPANPVAPRGEEAGPSNPVVPFPYHENEVIGGDSVLSIERRLLAKYSFPSYEVIRMARIQAEDLFEVKVQIIKIMAGLDPTGDWMGRGARALDNPRTVTGEPSLGKLYSIRDSLNEAGARSPDFVSLQGKMLARRVLDDEHSGT